MLFLSTHKKGKLQLREFSGWRICCSIPEIVSQRNGYLLYSHGQKWQAGTHINNFPLWASTIVLMRRIYFIIYWGPDWFQRREGWNEELEDGCTYGTCSFASLKGARRSRGSLVERCRARLQAAPTQKGALANPKRECNFRLRLLQSSPSPGPVTGLRTWNPYLPFQREQSKTSTFPSPVASCRPMASLYFWIVPAPTTENVLPISSRWSSAHLTKALSQVKGKTWDCR